MPLKGKPNWAVVVRPTLECNFSCSYCYISDNNRKRETRLDCKTFDKFVKLLLDTDCESVCFSWQGGEPTLVGLKHIQALLDWCEINLTRNGISNYHSLHTNGSLINSDWARLFAERNISVGVSLDGYPEINDKCRKPSNNALNLSAYSYALKAIELLDKRGVTVEVTSTISQPCDVDIEKIYSLYKALPVSRINVEPCLAYSPIFPFHNGNHWLHPYYDFMLKLLQYWIEDDNKPPIQYAYSAASRPPITI